MGVDRADIGGLMEVTIMFKNLQILPFYLVRQTFVIANFSMIPVIMVHDLLHGKLLKLVRYSMYTNAIESYIDLWTIFLIDHFQPMRGKTVIIRGDN